MEAATIVVQRLMWGGCDEVMTEGCEAMEVVEVSSARWVDVVDEAMCVRSGGEAMDVKEGAVEDGKR